MKQAKQTWKFSVFAVKRESEMFLKYRFFLSCFLMLFLAACGALPAQLVDGLPFAVTITPSPGRARPQQVLNSPEAQASPTLAFTPPPPPSPTLPPTSTPTAPTPTDTLLPPLDIPTERPNAPAFVAWTGEPTYPGDSEPGRLFRVDYDPDLWAQTKDNFEQVALAHREIPYCAITAWSGRGLPPDARVEHEFRDLGSLPYDVNTVIVGGAPKFVAYVGGDRRLLTGFQVTFQEQREACLLDAETILATLRSFIAEPTITPSFTPEPLVTLTPTP